jgi:Anti-sigma factor NepR
MEMSTAKFDRTANVAIGRHLRVAYDDMVRMAIPEQLMDVLRRLDEDPETSAVGRDAAGGVGHSTETKPS